MPHAKKILRFGIIGLGMMGREFASAAARWFHLLDFDFAPQITAICDTNTALHGWYTDNHPSITLKTTNYHDLLNSSEVDAIYCPVPHNLHQQFYIDILNAGKHLLGEKPFGIDLAANTAILQAVAAHPELVVCCSSEFPFLPGARRIMRMIEDDAFGEIFEVSTGLLHSSDLDPNKKINWKRMIAINGEYGCMGDLGMHVLHMPLRAGWMPVNVRALLSKIVSQRPNADGVLVPCETWDNATLCCEVDSDGRRFPMFLQTHRIAPGETNTWFMRVLGTKASAEFSSRSPKTFRVMRYTNGGEQAWQDINLGYETAYPVITAGILDFGFLDALLQMWAAFCDQLAHGRAGMRQNFYCVTPEETHRHHRILTAALESQKTRQTIAL